MAPPSLVPDSPAPPVEVAPDSPELAAESVALEDAESVALEDSVADDDSLAEEDASLAVDEASLAAEDPVSWLAPEVSLPPPVTPPMALLTASPAAEVIPPMMLGDVRELFVQG